MPKKRIITALLCIVLVAVLAGRTLAYLTDRQSATVSHEVGMVKIHLDNVQNGISEDLLPGSVYTSSKQPVIRLDGASEDCYVRLKVTLLPEVEKVVEFGPVGADWKHVAEGNTHYFYYGKVLSNDPGRLRQNTTSPFPYMASKGQPTLAAGDAGKSHHQLLLEAQQACGGDGVEFVAQAIQTFDAAGDAETAFKKWKYG